MVIFHSACKAVDMNERLLQFIWQFQYFNKQELTTTAGESIHVLKPGTWNHHQGPDFSSAIIRIGTTTWAGNIEIHIRSSDWFRHRHTGDKHYNNIILHVVWEEDIAVQADNGSSIPCLALQNLVPRFLLERYAQVMESGNTLPCRQFLPALAPLAWTAWKERLAAERLEKKAAQVLSVYAQTTGHWDEVCWQMLAANFGMQVNTALFASVAREIPLALLVKHRHQPLQVEALLMGQANLLEAAFSDSYPLLLKKEYGFLLKKYQLRSHAAQPAFLRMRPAGFPMVRMAQLAALVVERGHLFAAIKEAADLRSVIDFFRVTAGDYWNTHYRFDEPAPHQVKQLGESMAMSLLVNSVVPLLFAYGLYNNDESAKNKAIQWLYQLPAEQNQLTRNWQRYGITSHAALESQALIELTNHYCTQKRCLDCAVGSKILKT